ncbi:MAG: NAD-dependent malic enzyme [Verrucomicrobiia bacterium]|jgi:malate dehydrogenase (oxaloacetate-decarboxylating)(NADP+)
MSKRTAKSKPANIKRPPLRGAKLLQDPLWNKGTAFTEPERDALGLRGLLPPRVLTIEEQERRVLANFHKKPNDLERYVQLISLQDRNETLFYRVVMNHVEKTMPIIYTPTVGHACQEFGLLFRQARGLYISIKDRGRIARLLKNWSQKDVRVIVVTDGERILGLGDLGAFGMGIPIGKLSLYTACAGVDPAQCMPVMLDVGTENDALLRDPLYTGLCQRRVRGKDYDALVDEFVTAVHKTWPKALIQFEDFANINAFRLLEHYRGKICTFNDDIQGTAAVTLAGLYSALRVTGRAFRDQTILFLGAGEAGVGIGGLIASAMAGEGMSPDEARRKCWFVDSRGLVVKSRQDLAEHKLRFAHDHPFRADFLSAIRALKPTAIVGVSAMPKAFTQPVIEAMSELNERPIIFALSNPTSKAECSAEEAYAWSKGRAIYASGSPFPPCVYEGKTFVSGQGNNAYIFPGVGLGVIACEARHVTERMFAEAAKALAAQVQESDLAMGRVYPSLQRIQEVSASIAAAVAECAFKEGLARVRKPKNLLAFIRSKMWRPDYRSYV